MCLKPKTDYQLHWMYHRAWEYFHNVHKFGGGLFFITHPAWQKGLVIAFKYPHLAREISHNSHYGNSGVGFGGVQHEACESREPLTGRIAENKE